MKNSVLIIGLDGVPWDLLKPWIDEGKLPAFSKLLKKGSGGSLRTTIPPFSSSAWTSLFTGKNPGKHGIYEYTTDLGKLINSKSIKVAKIWQILSHYKKRCGVINVIMTYPVEKVNGYMVSGVLTPQKEKIYSYPSKLMSVLKKHKYEIRIRYGKNRLLPNKKYIIERRYDFLKKLYDILEKRYYTLKELMDEPWDFFMFVIDETAMLQHLFLDRKDVMLKFFKKIDFYIDDLIKTFSTKNTNPYIFVVSDHGFSSSPIRSLNMRVWLEKNGILKDNRTFQQKVILKVYNKLNKFYLSELILFFNKTRRSREVFQRKLSVSSSVYYKYPGIYIRQDQLKDMKYWKLRDNLIRDLRQIRDPLSNEKVFQIVEKKKVIYSGNYTKFVPDIVALPNYKYNVIFSYDSNTLFDDVEMHLRGKHFSDIYGMLLASGKEMRQGTIKNASIYDIFPTVLHILDVSLPKDLDGKVLKSIFKPKSYLQNKRIVYSEVNVKTLQEKNNIQDVLQNIKF